SDYSEISLGALSLAGSVEQKVQFNKALEPNSIVKLDMMVGAGVLAADVFDRIEVVGYNNGAEVYAQDLETAVLGGVNLLTLFNNGARAEVSFAPDVEVDEIGLRVISLVSVAAVPNIRLFNVAVDCTEPQFVGWKSFEINEDPALTSVSGDETVEYTIHLRNTGTVPMVGFILTDKIPDNTTLVANSITDGGVEAAGTITWQGIDVPVGEETTVSFSVTVDENLSGVTEISNVAYVKADEDDTGTPTYPPLDNENPTEPDDTGDTGTDIPVEHTNTLTVWKGYTIADGTSTTSVSGGETITYTIYIENTSNQDLEGLIVEDEIPLGTTHVSGGSFDGTKVTFTGIDVDFDETVSVSFVVTVNDDLSTVTEISNVAVVKTDGTDPGTGTVPPNDPSNPGAGPDPGATPGTPTVIPVNPIHSVEFDKIGLSNNAESDGKAEIGDEITYTLTVKNTGNKALTGIVVTDNLPADVAITDN